MKCTRGRDPLPIRDQAGKLLFAYIGEPGQHLAIDRLLILEDGEGPELESPLLELEQRDRGIACPAVTGETVNEERPGHPVDSAVHGVHPVGIVLRVAPVEAPALLGGHFAQQSSEILRECGPNALSRQKRYVGDLEQTLNKGIQRVPVTLLWYFEYQFPFLIFDSERGQG